MLQIIRLLNGYSKTSISITDMAGSMESIQDDNTYSDFRIFKLWFEAINKLTENH